MARSSGKVILLGEHAVVYGVPAIAAGIDRGAVATALPAPFAELQIGERSALLGDSSELGQAFLALMTELDGPPLSVTVSLDLPPGCGLGASAALGVAIARAVLEAMDSAPEGSPAVPRGVRAEQVLAGAMAWERVFHGNPSGIDAATSALGGCLLFTRGGGAQPLRLLRPIPIAIALAGPPASTREMVEGVARLRGARPLEVNRALDEIRSLVERAQSCLARGDGAGLGQLLNRNQDLLRELEVSTPSIDRACAVAQSAGAWGAKLTGSGGGGSVIALPSGDPGPVLDAWSRAGFSCFASVIGQEMLGALVE